MTATRPDKQLVRAYMAAPARKENPPPTPEEIRRQLGWQLCPENGTVPEVRNEQ